MDTIKFLCTPPICKGTNLMWYKNPKYLSTKDRFVSNFSSWKLTLLHSYLPKIVFICGGDEKYHPNRSKLENYIESHLPAYLTFRAENAWEIISEHFKADRSVKDTNALALEEWLADFSDIVIILVESFGTVAELGAFSISPVLRKKLLPILDEKYNYDESFINTGPIRWVDADSRYKPSIYTDFSTILTCMPELEKRMSKNRVSSLVNEDKHGKYIYSKKVLLFFVLYLVSSFGPISSLEVSDLARKIISLDDKKLISFMLSVGVALNIFTKHKINDETFFTCLDYEKLFRTDEPQKLLHSIQQARAKNLSKLLLIPEYKAVLERVVLDAS